jgi:hypothetical protein
MNKIIYNLLSCLLIIIIITSIFFNNNNLYQEPFVPKMLKERYRPIHRNVRMAYEGFYSKSSQHISNLFKKVGIL